MGLFRAFKSLLRRPSQRPFYVVGRLGRGEKARVGRWNSISSHRPLLLLLGCLCGPVINSAFGRRCRKVVSRGREDTRVWYQETMFSEMISYDFLAEPCTDTFCTSFLFLGCVRLGSLDFGFAIEREIRKPISTLRSLFLDFFFTENSFANPFSDFPIDR